eukprot:1159813-Pelagomonas_calceolata.AAC.27
MATAAANHPRLVRARYNKGASVLGKRAGGVKSGTGVGRRDCGAATLLLHNTSALPDQARRAEQMYGTASVSNEMGMRPEWEGPPPTPLLLFLFSSPMQYGLEDCDSLQEHKDNARDNGDWSSFRPKVQTLTAAWL